MSITVPCLRATPALQHGFLQLQPVIERHAQMVFRHLRSAEREEAVAETRAAAYVSYLRLRSRGKDPAEFPIKLATYATLRVKNDRHVGSRSSSQDVLARKAQRRRSFRVEYLPHSPHANLDHMYGDVGGQNRQDAYEERLQDDSQTPVPDQVAFRLDWPRFLTSLSVRDRRLAHYLSLGHSNKHAARKFGLTPGRVTQLRQRWCREWRLFQGDDPIGKRRAH
jgi:hypothetical protein